MINVEGIDEVYNAICKNPGITLDGLQGVTLLLYPIDVVMQLQSRGIIISDKGYKLAENAERKLRELKEHAKRK